jgi:hypothetical protein
MNKLVDRLNWQSTLFSGAIPKRVELASLNVSWDCSTQRIRIHRNHSFEHIASIMQPYFTYSGWYGDFIYSVYDDSLGWGLTHRCASRLVVRCSSLAAHPLFGTPGNSLWKWRMLIGKYGNFTRKRHWLNSDLNLFQDLAPFHSQVFDFKKTNQG